MATYVELIDGLKILSGYDGEDSQGVSAEHDVIYSGPGTDQLRSEDVKTLEDLGWYYDVSLECWAHYT